jgi:hypothetical protein
MSTVTTTPRPLSLLSIDFPDLYARHLCRHSQFGINVAHLVALFGTWYAVYAIVYELCKVEWVPIALAIAYLAVLATNVPVRVVVACAGFLALFVAAVLWGVPAADLPIWVYVLMVPVFYKLQSWSHKVWHVEKDMTEFNKRFPKGFTLFVILLIYEVPIVLNFLLWGSKNTAE